MNRNCSSVRTENLLDSSDVFTESSRLLELPFKKLSLKEISIFSLVDIVLSTEGKTSFKLSDVSFMSAPIIVLFQVGETFKISVTPVSFELIFPEDPS